MQYCVTKRFTGFLWENISKLIVKKRNEIQLAMLYFVFQFRFETIWGSGFCLN